MSVIDRTFSRQVRHVTPLVATDLAAQVSKQIRRDLGGVLPPYAAHLPAPDVLAACWAIMREPSMGTGVTRTAKEAVAAAVSATNACPYCVDVHTTTLHALAEPAAGTAIASGQDGHIADPALRAIVAWARATRSPDSPALDERPFTDTEAPELIGTAIGFHYINRMVSVFLVDSPFPFVRGEAGKRGLKRLIAPGMRRMVRPARPGDALDLLPEAEHPSDVGWAKADPTIHTAFARSAAAFEDAGSRDVPEAVRHVVTARLQRWRGEDMPLSGGWVHDALAEVPEPQRPAGRFALLTAFAPYRVDDRVVAEYRAQAAGGDHALVATAAWASFAAARRIGEWL